MCIYVVYLRGYLREYTERKTSKYAGGTAPLFFVLTLWRLINNRDNFIPLTKVFIHMYSVDYWSLTSTYKDNAHGSNLSIQLPPETNMDIFLGTLCITLLSRSPCRIQRFIDFFFKSFLFLRKFSKNEIEQLKCLLLLSHFPGAVIRSLFCRVAALQ